MPGEELGDLDAGDARLLEQRRDGASHDGARSLDAHRSQDVAWRGGAHAPLDRRLQCTHRERLDLRDARLDAVRDRRGREDHVAVERRGDGGDAPIERGARRPRERAERRAVERRRSCATTHSVVLRPASAPNRVGARTAAREERRAVEPRAVGARARRRRSAPPRRARRPARSPPRARAPRSAPALGRAAPDAALHRDRAAPATLPTVAPVPAPTAPSDHVRRRAARTPRTPSPASDARRIGRAARGRTAPPRARSAPRRRRRRTRVRAPPSSASPPPPHRARRPSRRRGGSRRRGRRDGWARAAPARACPSRGRRRRRRSGRARGRRG